MNLFKTNPKMVDAILHQFELKEGKVFNRATGQFWIDRDSRVVLHMDDETTARPRLRPVQRILEAAGNGDVEDAWVFSSKKQATLQQQMDTNRVERALVRKEVRALNASNDRFEVIAALLTENAYRLPPPKEDTSACGTIVIQFSDTHFGTTVELPNNVVNMKVLSARVREFTHKAIDFGLRVNARRAVVVLTGDIITSDRRTSEQASIEYNRAHAALNAFEIISQAIADIQQYFSVSHVVSVLGNEGRILQNLDFEHKAFYENYDWIVDRMLANYFPSIKFSEHINPVEKVLEIDGVKILVTHGITKPKMTPGKQVEYYRKKYSDLDWVLCGHIHEPLVSQGYSRSGSLVGGNCYSEFGLGIATSMPSQTFHFISDRSVYSFPINLACIDSSRLYSFTPPPKTRDIITTEIEVL